MHHIKALLVGTAIVASITLHAQPKPAKASNAELQKSIQDLGNLFKKKKKDSTTATTGGPQANSGAQAPNVNRRSSTSGGGMKPGDVLPTAKVLDVDMLSSFNNGVASVMKGSSYALINARGDFVIPFNTYGVLNSGIVYSQYAMFMNGLIQYRTLDEREWGYLNSAGKVIARGILNGVTDNKRLLRVNNSNHTTTYTTPEGKSFTHAEPLDDINEGIGIVRKTINNGNGALFMYRRLTGEPLTSATFQEAYPFSDGMALVGKRNEFGEMKYGYIDAQGKLAVPFSFSIKPANFSGGFAKVEPKDKTAFEYAFINKQGEIVFKQTLAEVSKYGKFERFTNFGMAFTDRYILDTDFKITPKKSFFASYGIPEDSWFNQEQNYMENETNPKLFFSIRGVNSKSTTYPLVGFINLADKKVVMPAFDVINQNAIYFDPVSHLAYAKTPLGRNEKNVPVYREGYINEDGLFVFVKGTGSKW